MNIDNDITKTKLFITIYIIVFLLLAPWLSFLIGYAFGWLSKITIGKYLVSALELIGLTIPLDKIPLIGGLLGWISSFFNNAIIRKE